MHNLAVIGGQTAMVYQGQTPWHSLGTFMEGATTQDVAGAMFAANLNWNVKHEPVFLADGRRSPFNQAVIRDVDNVIIGGVGPKSVAIQNERAFSVLEPLVKEFGVTIETAGALGNGARCWMLAKMPEKIEVVPGDSINGYFLVIHAHDGSHALDGIPTGVRVVCQNTMDMALEGIGRKGNTGRMFKVKHTASADLRIEEAGKLMKKVMGAMQETGDTFRTLATKKMTPKMVAEFIESVIPMPEDGSDSKTATERRKTIAALVFTGMGAEMAGSNLTTGETTAWAAYNAITEYFDHVRPAEAKSPTAIAKANESALFGANADIKRLALKRVRQLVAA